MTGTLRKLLPEVVNAKRVLALVLLASLSWAATVEVTHHHQVPGTVGSATESASIPDGITSAIVDARGQTTSSRIPLNSGECSICQLHQNLFTSLFTHTLISAPVVKQGSYRPAGEILYLSPFKSARQGRAPPLNL